MKQQATSQSQYNYPRLANSGFTLIELLLALLLLGLVTGLAVLSPPDRARYQLSQTAQSLQQTSVQLQHAANQRSEVFALGREGQDLIILRRQLLEDKMQWQEAAEFKKLRPIPDTIRLSVIENSNRNKATDVGPELTPLVAFFTSGETTPFTFRLERVDRPGKVLELKSDGFNIELISQ